MAFKDKVFKPQWVEKGWGGEIICVNKKEYCGKILVFEKGKRCSFHHHGEEPIKDEVFYLIKGKLILRLSDQDDISAAEEFILNQGECFYIYPGLRHQMEGLEDINLLVEFSTEDKPGSSKRIIKGD